jgi:16S rRNA (guanine(966)-N(2))-methyltransferase RsmD
MKDSKKKKNIRPTTGKVREALFNILRNRIEGAVFLDLYAGTGAVGIEALRQGAAEAVLVEAKRTGAQKIRKLVEYHQFTDKARVIIKKVAGFVEWAELREMTFDIIFLDPPYYTDEILTVLSSLGRSGLVRNEGIVIAEHFKKTRLPVTFHRLQRVKVYAYGDTLLTVYAMS